MRVILIGQAAFAEKVLDGLLERGHEVAAVYCPPDRPGAKPDPLKLRADELGISVRQHKTLKLPEVQREFADLDAELGILAYVTQIVPKNMIDTPKLGCICFHPSLLPKYRGGSAIPWQIIKGEEKTGVTVFWTDAGIDTGPILVQKETTIRPEDTAATLYYDSLFPLGITAVLESVDLIAAGTAPRLTQDPSKGSYDPLCTDEHALVQWDRPAVELDRLIRGCDPQPGAFVDRDSLRVRLYDAHRIDGSDLAPGIIGAIDETGLTVGAVGGAIRIGKIKGPDKKLSAIEAARQLNLVVGARF